LSAQVAVAVAQATMATLAVAEALAVTPNDFLPT
jgi:hypothetical protein